MKEKKKIYTMSITPSVFEKFKNKVGKGSISYILEQLMKEYLEKGE